MSTDAHHRCNCWNRLYIIGSICTTGTNPHSALGYNQILSVWIRSVAYDQWNKTDVMYNADWWIGCLKTAITCTGMVGEVGVNRCTPQQLVTTGWILWVEYSTHAMVDQLYQYHFVHSLQCPLNVSPAQVVTILTGVGVTTVGLHYSTDEPSYVEYSTGSK